MIHIWIRIQTRTLYLWRWPMSGHHPSFWLGTNKPIQVYKKSSFFWGGGKALLAKLSAKYEVCKTKMFLIKITCQIKLEDQDWREVSEISGYTLSHPGQKRNVLYYKNKIQAILNFQRKGEIAHKFFSQKRRNTKKKFAKFRFFVKFSFAGNRF